MKSRKAAAFLAVTLIAFAGILAGCAGGPKGPKGPAVRTDELDNKGNAIGVPTPDWIKQYVAQGVTAVQGQPQFKDKYCIVGEESSTNKQFAVAWADSFSAQQRIGAMLRTNIASKYEAAVSGTSQSTGGANSSTAAGGGSADYKQEIDNSINSVVNVSYSGAQRDSDWWVLTRRYDPDQEGVYSDEYTAYVLYTIPKAELNRQIASALETSVSKDSALYDITIRLAQDILLNGVNYLEAAVPAPQAAAPASAAQSAGAIANGTYTFFPRPRALQGGIEVNAYLDKIVFNDEYTLIYVSSAAQGVTSSSLASSLAGNWYASNIILTDADNPARTYQPANVGNSEGDDTLLSFRRIPAAKFQLRAGEGERGVVFGNIALPASPDK